MLTNEKFPALIVSQSDRDDKSADCLVSEMNAEQLGAGEVVVRITHSALNYKDALASTGNRGVVRKFPLVLGIDAVGEVVESTRPDVKQGDRVLIAAAEFGTAHHGGLAAFAKVPADWVFPIPNGLSSLDAITWGTAGFTAAQSVEKILEHNVKPSDGDVLVTGATGGVGIFAVKLLAKLGYRVVAATGKTEQHDWLRENGADEIVDRSAVCDESQTPMLKSRWAAAVDSVGGNTLATVLRAAKLHSCITACGLVGGHQLDMTVYPFILRGVTLCGIDSANISRQTRIDLWNKIANDWQLELVGLRNEVGLSGVGTEMKKMLAGKSFGRTVVTF